MGKRRLLPPLVFLGLGGLLLLAAALALTWGPFVRGAQPRLALDREQIDFGPVAVDTPVTAEFILRNAGSAPLLIEVSPRVEVIEGC